MTTASCRSASVRERATLMQWVRVNRRFGAWCALVALALQIILSFGHTHAIGRIAAGGHASATAVHALKRGDPDSPRGSSPFEYCPVCAVIKMGASAVPPDAPAWCLPAIAGDVRFAPCTEVAVRSPEHRPFHARAPPPV
ncbi:MAG: DUF2946 family protein [Bradyrhizobiaceae bacterium]|nr:DUF2946 family protein [Bradyrhizobiaceae bacterium]